MISRIIKIVWIFLIAGLFTEVVLAKTSWDVLSPGLAYTEIKLPTINDNARLHVFRVDLKNFDLSLAFARENDTLFSSVRNLMRSKEGWVAINGGFFSPDMNSLGLRIRDGVQLSRFKRSSWWGVFLIERGRAKIVSAKQYQPGDGISFAIQSGPRLIIDGKTPKLRPGVAKRSALGILRNGQVLIAATENAYLSTTELAEIMRRSEANDGLNCWQAINLDGGSSTQLYAKVNDFELSVPSFMPVADVVVVLPKVHG